MNKLTKLLSIFLIAGLIGTGAAVGMTGCKTPAEEGPGTEQGGNTPGGEQGGNTPGGNTPGGNTPGGEEQTPAEVGLYYAITTSPTGWTIDDATFVEIKKDKTVEGDVEGTCTIANGIVTVTAGSDTYYAKLTGKILYFYATGADATAGTNVVGKYYKGETLDAADKTALTEKFGDGVKAAISAINITAANDATAVVVGKTLQLSATVTVNPDEDKYKGITWSVTTGSEFATIDAATGLLTATGVSTTNGVVVTATSTYDSTKTKTFYLTVNDKSDWEKFTEQGAMTLMNDFETAGTVDMKNGATDATPAALAPDGGMYGFLATAAQPPVWATADQVAAMPAEASITASVAGGKLMLDDNYNNGGDATSVLYVNSVLKPAEYVGAPAESGTDMPKIVEIYSEIEPESSGNYNMLNLIDETGTRFFAIRSASSGTAGVQISGEDGLQAIDTAPYTWGETNPLKVRIVLNFMTGTINVYINGQQVGVNGDYEGNYPLYGALGSESGKFAGVQYQTASGNRYINVHAHAIYVRDVNLDDCKAAYAASITDTIDGLNVESETTDTSGYKFELDKKLEELKAATLAKVNEFDSVDAFAAGAETLMDTMFAQAKPIVVEYYTAKIADVYPAANYTINKTAYDAAVAKFTAVCEDATKSVYSVVDAFTVADDELKVIENDTLASMVKVQIEVCSDATTIVGNITDNDGVKYYVDDKIDSALLVAAAKKGEVAGENYLTGLYTDEAMTVPVEYAEGKYVLTEAAGTKDEATRTVTIKLYAKYANYEEKTYALDIAGMASSYTAETELGTDKFFSATNKVKTEAALMDAADATDTAAAGKYNGKKQVTLTGGKVQLSGTDFLNGIKFTLVTPGTVTVVGGVKTGKNVKLAVINEEGKAATVTNIHKNDAAETIDAFDNMTVAVKDDLTVKPDKYTFDLAAGTYYLGGGGGGAYIYELSVATKGYGTEKPYEPAAPGTGEENPGDDPAPVVTGTAKGEYTLTVNATNLETAATTDTEKTGIALTGTTNNTAFAAPVISLDTATFKADKSVVYTLTLRGMKAGQTATIKFHGKSGSDIKGSDGTTKYAVNPATLSLSATNGTLDAASVVFNEAVGGTPVLTAAAGYEDKTVTVTATADGDVVITFSAASSAKYTTTDGTSFTEGSAGTNTVKVQTITVTVAAVA